MLYYYNALLGHQIPHCYTWCLYIIYKTLITYLVLDIDSISSVFHKHEHVFMNMFYYILRIDSQRLNCYIKNEHNLKEFCLFHFKTCPALPALCEGTLVLGTLTTSQAAPAVAHSCKNSQMHVIFGYT